MPAEQAQSSESKPRITRDVAETILRLFREIWFKYFLQQVRPALVLKTEERTESVAEQAGSIATIENDRAEPTTAISFVEQTTVDVNVSSDAQISPVAHVVLDQEEIRRRRDLVRTLFNDFWSGADDKPAGFADRLNQAENYINERLTACGEFWQLDAKTRTMLSLPPGSKSADNGKTG